MASIVASPPARSAHLEREPIPWLTHYYQKMIQLLLHQPPDILGFVVLAAAAVAAVSLHEFAHAVVARWQGDPTPKLAGRMTLNPKRHLDPVGSFIILLVGFGWGKPVPVAENRFRSGKWGTVMVALAGPLANVLLAFIFALVLALLGPRTNSEVERLIFAAFSLNIMMALFNLLPVPPLDGFPILAKFLPPRRYEVLVFLEKWSFLILLVAAFLVFSTLAAPFANALGRAILRMAGISL